MLKVKNFGKISFVHQADWSGNISIVVPADAVDVDERLGLVTVQVPFEAMRKFVDGYNRERILKAKDSDDIIIVLVGAEEKIND